jgi:hypothetical protein
MTIHSLTVAPDLTSLVLRLIDAQPATWPFLTRFNAVARDSAPKFPWPFTVRNPLVD